MTAPVMPTSGPWAYTFRAGECSEGTITSEDDWLVAVVAGQNHGQWRDTDDNGDTEFEANARFIVAACNSYDRHFGPRAIEAAEADLLGRCLEALRECRDQFQKYANLHSLKGTLDGDAKAISNMAFAEKCEAILSQASEVK